MRVQLSIITKLSLLVTGAVIVTAFAVNEIYIRGSSQILIDHVIADLEQETDFFRFPLENKISQTREDIQLLAQLRATKNIADARGHADSTDELTDIFSEMLRTTPYYRYISFIGANDNGTAILRVGRNGGQIERALHALPQDDRNAMLQDVLRRAPGEIALSDLHLSRKDGKVTQPHTLIMQAAIPVYTDEKTVFGIILIEADFGMVLGEIQQQLASADTFYVTNEAGDYLLHRDPSRLFATDLGGENHIQRQYPALLPVMSGIKNEKATLLPEDKQNGNVLAYKKYHYDALNPDHYLGIAVEAPYQNIVRDISEVEQRGFLFSGAIAVLAVGAGVLLLRFLIRPLNRIAYMVVRYRGGEKNIVLPADSPDEIGVLAREFQSMMQQKDEEDWVKENLVGITKNLLGFKSLSAFASALMESAAPAVGAQLGVIYLSSSYTHQRMEHDRESLSFLGAYGYKAQAGFPDLFYWGEGLVGQCAKSRERLLVSDIPDTYLHIASGLGESKPRHLMLLPILFENRLVGVMELATVHGFSAIHIAFLERLCFNAGVIINGISSAMRTEELLEEARMTAEELQRSEEELKTQQEELQVSNEELEEKTKALEEQNTQIRQQSGELEKNSQLIREKVEELQRANTYKSEFLANMSHELRTPLNSLLILARSLAGNEDGNLTAEQIEEANVIHNGGLELLNLINDILDLSKVEAGKISIISEDVPLDGIVRRMEQQFMPVAGEKGVAFQITSAGILPATLHTDAQRVEQILKNLLSNAFKFTQTGSVTLELRRIDNRVAFSVIDTGIGIEESKFRDIFEAFQQEDGSIDRHYGGTGLGLTIARKFAHILGGEIHVESQKGAGSRFTLLLPLSHTQAAQAYVAQAPSKPVAPMPKTPLDIFIPDDRKRIVDKDKTLLIIEDDRDFAAILMKMAHKHGYKCLAAGDGKTGLLLASEHPITAIILDLRLPDIDGIQVLDQLKHDLRTRHIPVHIITADADRESVVPLRKGAIGYLAKPLAQEDIDSVFGKIEDMLQAKVKKLLVVEDDTKTQTAIRSLLKKSDIDITIASTGSTALEQLAAIAFDCIILDLRLPDMTGFEWLEHMEQAMQGNHPPVIIYTARELTEEEHRRLHSYTGSIVIKGAHSSERLLDEVTLFLHSVESTLSTDQQDIIRMQHDPDKALQGRTVLLVDDDLRNTFALTKLLKKRGLTIVIADNGQMALDKLKTEKAIDLVIMDIMMPIMDGYQAIREIRAQPIHAQLPIIALTARAMPEEQEKCMAAGANDYLTKPVDVERLLTLLRVWLFRQEKIT